MFKPNIKHKNLQTCRFVIISVTVPPTATTPRLSPAFGGNKKRNGRHSRTKSDYRPAVVNLLVLAEDNLEGNRQKEGHLSRENTLAEINLQSKQKGGCLMTAAAADLVRGEWGRSERGDRNRAMAVELEGGRGAIL
ncbi:hypothetical protein GWI33_017886 [Rhynchophorus ferrugineus]|uniref:Uncharacterized protein n=1 Tax=Rhynchophorus ferrugineus TaxID=354439 RepID=A0A834HYC2_RHYFE|nr:hypothetical protein GWI33_017886 [Rhynchophorus ferrugineus]